MITLDLCKLFEEFDVQPPVALSDKGRIRRSFEELLAKQPSASNNHTAARDASIALVTCIAVALGASPDLLAPLPCLALDDVDNLGADEVRYASDLLDDDACLRSPRSPSSELPREMTQAVASAARLAVNASERGLAPDGDPPAPTTLPPRTD